MRGNRKTHVNYNFFAHWAISLWKWRKKKKKKKKTKSTWHSNYGLKNIIIAIHSPIHRSQNVKLKPGREQQRQNARNEEKENKHLRCETITIVFSILLFHSLLILIWVFPFVATALVVQTFLKLYVFIGILFQIDSVCLHIDIYKT